MRAIERGAAPALYCAIHGKLQGLAAGRQAADVRLRPTYPRGLWCSRAYNTGRADVTGVIVLQGPRASVGTMQVAVWINPPETIKQRLVYSINTRTW